MRRIPVNGFQMAPHPVSSVSNALVVVNALACKLEISCLNVFWNLAVAGRVQGFLNFLKKLLIFTEFI